MISVVENDQQPWLLHRISKLALTLASKSKFSQGVQAWMVQLGYNKKEQVQVHLVEWDCELVKSDQYKGIDLVCFK